MTTTILVTGSGGFVGRNLRATLMRQEGLTLLGYDLGSSSADLTACLAQADIVYHLAGVNRPQQVGEYHTGNVGLTQEICRILELQDRAPKIVFSSSVQAALDNPYGISKREAEDELQRFSERTGAEVVIYRFKNLFGKWSRPNYNSVVATFCHNVAHDLPITISDPAREIELVYIDDAVDALFSETLSVRGSGTHVADVPAVGCLSLGELAERIRAFRALRSSLVLPLLDRFTRCLYATYLSYLAPDDLAYSLQLKADARGGLAELLKGESFGQIFVSRTHPGITRGNHYHRTKTEKFVVLEGEALIRFRHILSQDVLEYRVSGSEFRVVDIPPGYTHNITNAGDTEMIVLFWASEVFDPAHADTYAELV